MLLRSLLRPSVLLSLAVHGGLFAVAVVTVTGGGPGREATVLGLLTMEGSGPVDAPEVAASRSMEEARLEDLPPTVVQPPAEPPAEPLEAEPPELPAAREERLALLAFDRAPVGVRVSAKEAAPRTPAATSQASSTVSVAVSTAPPSTASKAGRHATMDARRRPGNRAPSYPAEAYRNGWEGTTWLVVEVLEDGRVGRVTVEQSSGHEALDSAAVEAVREWLYEPRIVEDSPARDLLRLPVQFRLRVS